MKISARDRLPDLIRFMEPNNFIDRLNETHRTARVAQVTATTAQRTIPPHNHAFSELILSSSLLVRGNASILGDASFGQHIWAASSASISGSLNVGGITLFAAAASFQGAASVFGNFTAASHFWSGSSASISGSLHVGGLIRIDTPKTPTEGSAAGDIGEVCWDASFLYICVAQNSWQRIASASW